MKGQNVFLSVIILGTSCVNILVLKLRSHDKLLQKTMKFQTVHTFILATVYLRGMCSQMLG